jgi:hypothetical protein
MVGRKRKALRRALREVAQQQPQVRGKARRHAVVAAAGLDPAALANDGELRALYDEIVSEMLAVGTEGEMPAAAAAGENQSAAPRGAAGAGASGASAGAAAGRKRGRSDKSAPGRAAGAADAAATIDAAVAALGQASSSSSSSSSTSSSSSAAALRQLLQGARHKGADDEAEVMALLGKAVAAVLSSRDANAISATGALAALIEGEAPGDKRPRKGEAAAEQALAMSQALARLLVLAGQHDKDGKNKGERGKPVASTAEIRHAVAAELSSLTRAEVNDIKLGQIKRAVALRLKLDIAALSSNDSELRAFFIAAVMEATRARLEALAEEQEVADESAAEEEEETAADEADEGEEANGAEGAHDHAGPAHVPCGEKGKAAAAEEEGLEDEDDDEQRAKERRWTEAEIAKLLALVRNHGRHWTLISSLLDTGRTPAQCCAKVYRLQRGGRAGPLPSGKRWTPTEEAALAAAVATFCPAQPPIPGVVDINTVDWVKVSTEVGRPSEQCRRRYRMEHEDEAKRRTRQETQERAKAKRAKANKQAAKHNDVSELM